MSPSPPTTAVIIPVRNGASFIDQALASIAAQTLPANEVIVADDGSEDDTVRRVSRWTDVLPLTVLRTETRVGTWNARHTAISAASADLIIQLDADDILLPQHIAVMRRAYEREPSLVAANRLLWEHGEQSVPEPLHEPLPEAADQLGSVLVLNCMGIGAAFSRQTYHEVGGYRPCRYAEDWDLWIRFAAAGVSITLPQERTYIYRMHAANISSRVDRRVTDLEILDKFLEDCTDPAYRRVAALAKLQRAGATYLDALPRSTAATFSAQETGIASPSAVHTDPDLGLVVRGTSPGVERFAVFTPERELVAQGELRGTLPPRIDRIGPGLRGLNSWPYPA